MNKQTITPNSNTLAAAFRRHQAGELELAQTLYRQILQIEPQHAETLHLLGLLYHQTGRSEPAIDAIWQAIEQDGDNALYWSSLALVYRETGQLAAAADCYRRLLQLTPEDANNHHALGVTLAELGQSAEAIASFRQAVDLQPDHADALYNLGVLLGRRQQHDEAVACYRQVLAIRPDYAGAVYNLAVLRRRQNRVDEALDFYRHATALRPDNAFWRLEQDTVFPLMMPNSQTIDDWRGRLGAALSHYPSGSIDLAAHLPAITTSNALPTLYLNYHGRNDQALKEQYARLFTVTGPLAAPPVARRPAPPYRLGFVVTGQHEGIFLRMVGGLLDQLTPDRFAISIICPSASVDHLRAGFNRDDITFLPLTPDLPHSILHIKDQQLDLVYYWEVGSDSLNYFLPFFGLAPVQVTSWGSMGTTSLPHIDTYISSRYFEPPDAAAHYSEQLVQLDSLLTYVERPRLPQPLKPRAAFGLPANTHLYLCPQSLLKIQPDFDAILAEILRRDPAGQLLFINGYEPQWQTDLKARWQTTMPDVVDRIRFLPRQNYADYLNLLAEADVVLDTIHFNGGATSYDALATGTPVVTMPTGLMRGQMTAGCYRRIGVLDCVADSPAAYVDLAVRLATQPQLRETVKAKILTANHLLYQDGEVVRELERCFEHLIEKAPLIQSTTGSGSRERHQAGGSGSANGNIAANLADKLLPVLGRHPKGNLVHGDVNNSLVSCRLRQAQAAAFRTLSLSKGEPKLWPYLRPGVLEAGEKSYRHTLGNDPSSAEVWYQLGLEARQNGQPETAIDYLNQAIALDSADARSYYVLGSICKQLGRRLEAINNLRQAVTLEPELAEAWYDLGFLLAKEKRWDEAEQCYRTVVDLQPHNATAHYQLGGALWQQQKIEASVEHFKQAIQSNPEMPMAYAFLAQGLASLGFRDKAIENYEKALELRPNDAALHNDLGVVLMRQKFGEEAETHFRRSLTLIPDRAIYHYNLGTTLEQQHRYDAAVASFEHAVALNPEQVLWQLKANSVCPAVTTSRSEIISWRNEFEVMLNHQSYPTIDLGKWLPEIRDTNIQAPLNLLYHGLDDRQIKEKYARLFAVSRLFDYEVIKKKNRNPLYRVGFLVTEGHEGIFVKIMAGLIRNLNDARIEPVIISHASSLNSIRNIIRNERVAYVSITGNLDQIIDQIKSTELDLLYFWEVGTDATNYFLPFFRLAPVQCTSWGSMSTTGISQIDYFISSELFETKNADSHYSERLIQLSNIPAYCYRPSSEQTAISRARFGLSEKDHVYLCVQNLIKFHHDFDSLLAQILRKDRLGKLVLVARPESVLLRKILDRFKSTMPDVMDRVHVLRPQPYDTYLRLVELADAVLDTVYICGGATTLETLAVGTPIVTLPTQFMRGRMTSGFYQKIGVTDCIAQNADQYVECALKLGKDQQYRNFIKSKILETNHVLFEDITAVRELEEFFLWAIKKAVVSRN